MPQNEMDLRRGMSWSCHFQSGNIDFKKLYEEIEGKYLEFTEKRKKDEVISGRRGNAANVFT